MKRSVDAHRGYEMETFKTRLGVSDGNGGATQWVEALVDTGATYTVLPSSILQGLLGVQPRVQEEFTFADGRKMLKPVGEARHHVEDREAISRVVFGDDGAIPTWSDSTPRVRVDSRHY